MKKILILEDHKFYIKEIIDELQDQGYTIDHATRYQQAEELIQKNTYDFAILDVILQNGKTGLHFAEKYSSKINKITFLTGCVDDVTLDAITRTPHASMMKGPTIWDTLEEFLAGGVPKIAFTTV